MALRALAASVLLAGLGASFLYVGCSKAEEPDCERDGQCATANTACTRGLCRDGKCLAEALPEGTRPADQSSVKDKYCVELRCNKTGAPVEVALGSKVPAEIACKKNLCDGMTLKTESILDGVPCESGAGTCRGGVCKPNEDSGTPPTDTGTADTGDMMEAAVDAATD